MASIPDEWDRVCEFKRELKADWALLWKTKFEDELKAEGVSSKDFERLFVNRGEVLFATRDFKPLNFRDILERYLGADLSWKVDPDSGAGGWGKFIKENFSAKKTATRHERPKMKFDPSQQQRKNGRGWLNLARIYSKMRSSERQ